MVRFCFLFPCLSNFCSLFCKGSIFGSVWSQCLLRLGFSTPFSAGIDIIPVTRFILFPGSEQYHHFHMSKNMSMRTILKKPEHQMTVRLEKIS